MISTGCIKFKGEIEKYLRKDNHNFEFKIDEALSTLKVKTLLCRTNIIKKEGYHAAHLLFMLILLPLLNGQYHQQLLPKALATLVQGPKRHSLSVQKNTNYRWRSFMCKINLQIFKAIKLDKIPLKERYFLKFPENYTTTSQIRFK